MTVAQLCVSMLFYYSLSFCQIKVTIKNLCGLVPVRCQRNIYANSCIQFDGSVKKCFSQLSLALICRQQIKSLIFCWCIFILAFESTCFYNFCVQNYSRKVRQVFRVISELRMHVIQSGSWATESVYGSVELCQYQSLSQIIIFLFLTEWHFFSLLWARFFLLFFSFFFFFLLPDFLPLLIFLGAKIFP